jgi:hypothetical protein
MADHAARLLLAALRAPGEFTAAADWEAAADLALRQGVAPLLCHRLQADAGLRPLSASLLDGLIEQRRETALDNLRKYGEFRRVAQALGAAGIPLIALKGLHLAELVYRDISLRPMSDLDILVPRERVAEALQLLRGIGFGHDAELHAAVAGMLESKCNIGLAHGQRDIWLEVHWALDEPGARSAGPLPEIWRSARPARLGDADTLVMTPEFLLLHVCAHLACNHAFAFSLRALCDIAEIVRANPQLDWNAVVAHGSRHGWARGVTAALRLAREHLGVPVPPQALASLGAEKLDAGLLEEAMTHLLEAPSLPDGLVTAPNLLAAAGAVRLQDKAALLWGRLFVPRAELALLYGVPEDSPTLPFYYALRLRDLVRRYATGMWALGIGNPAAAAAARRHSRLRRWIADTWA